MRDSGRQKDGIGFLDLDMRLVYEILYLLIEDVPQGHGRFDISDYVKILKLKGYGKHKVAHTVKVLTKSKVMVKHRETWAGSKLDGKPKYRKREWRYVYGASAKAPVLYDVLKSHSFWTPKRPYYFEIRDMYSSRLPRKAGKRIERKKGGVV